MPIYEFKCIQCHNKFEEIIPVNKKIKIICPSCGSDKIQKCVSTFGISGIDKNISSSSGSCSSCSSDSCKTCS
jgi:putative FmdB family regulatory protein